MNCINDIISSIKESSSKENNKSIIGSENDSNDDNIKSCQKSIKNLCNSLWIQGFINKTNNIKKLEKQNSKKMINTNYYIHEGYYSHLNLKYCLKNIKN